MVVQLGSSLVLRAAGLIIEIGAHGAVVADGDVVGVAEVLR